MPTGFLETDTGHILMGANGAGKSTLVRQLLAALKIALDDCPCALLLVSHDQHFLRRLTRVTWHIAAEDAPDALTLQVRQRSDV